LVSCCDERELFACLPQPPHEQDESKLTSTRWARATVRTVWYVTSLDPARHDGIHAVKYCGQ
jgi:hypothetical protein